MNYLLIFFLIELILFALWLALLISDSLLYQEWKKNQEKKKKQEIEAKKKRFKEFKWPEHLPRHDL